MTKKRGLTGKSRTELLARVTPTQPEAKSFEGIAYLPSKGRLGVDAV